MFYSDLPITHAKRLDGQYNLPFSKELLYLLESIQIGTTHFNLSNPSAHVHNRNKGSHSIISQTLQFIKSHHCRPAQLEQEK
jgi:hypothetical protein